MTEEVIHVFRNENDRALDASFITNWVMIFSLWLVGGLLAYILIQQHESGLETASARKRFADQNEKILNNQEITMANLKWANTMIHARCKDVHP